MKVGCQQCSCHFGDEFEKTLIPPCNYWGDLGMANLPVEYKKKIWDALTGIPFDEIGIKYKLSLNFAIWATAINTGDRFEEIDPDWNKKTDAERRAFQKEYFRKKKLQEKKQEQKLKPVEIVIKNSKDKPRTIN